MFKLVVLCAFLAAAAVAEPSAPFLAPLTYSSTILSPATTTITKQASSVVHPSPHYYSAPFAYTHFIKKRSAPLALASNYFPPTTYLAAAPYAAPAYVAPYIQAPYYAPTPLAYTAPAHFIKKRSAPLALPLSYIAPTSYSSQSRIDVQHSAPIYSSYTAPLAYSSHYAYPYFG